MKLTSIILTCKIRNKTEAHMTMTSIDSINKYTNPEEYELIVVDPEPSEAIRDDYKVFPPYVHLTPSPDPDYSNCMNLGAEQAKGEYLVFIQNDVFVHEGWLAGLRQYLDTNNWDVIFPDQVARSRQYILDSYERPPFDPISMIAGRDEGLVMMTREIFDRVGGWPKDMSLLVAKVMYERLGKVKARFADTNKVQITHIMGASNWKLHADNYQEYSRRMDKDAKEANG